MDSTKSEHKAYVAVRAALRALSHKIRTPLSTITNDLSYLTKQYPNESLDKTLEKSYEIAAILSSLELPSTVELESTSWEALKNPTEAANRQTPSIEFPKGLAIKFPRLFNSIAEKIGAASLSLKDSSAKSAEFEFKQCSRLPKSPSKELGLSELVSDVLGLDTLDSSHIELLLIRIGADISAFYADTTLTISIRMP